MIDPCAVCALACYTVHVSCMCVHWCACAHMCSSVCCRLRPAPADVCVCVCTGERSVCLTEVGGSSWFEKEGPVLLQLRAGALDRPTVGRDVTEHVPGTLGGRETRKLLSKLESPGSREVEGPLHRRMDCLGWGDSPLSSPTSQGTRCMFLPGPSA